MFVVVFIAGGTSKPVALLLPTFARRRDLTVGEELAEEESEEEEKVAEAATARLRRKGR